MPCDDTSGSSADSTMFGNRIEECPAFGQVEVVYYGGREGAPWNNVECSDVALLAHRDYQSCDRQIA